MHIIVGLGNPGYEYDCTRHNVGFEVIDKVALHLRATLKPGKGDYNVAFVFHNDVELGLVKPLTYMNNSGEAIVDLRDRYNVQLEQFLIVCDDFQLPLGTLRLRPGGSDGGHNGLYSIIYHLQSDAFPRLRCGIASKSLPHQKSLMARFVLESFTPEERPDADEMVNRAGEACLYAVTEGLEKAMNLYNSKPTN